jgi:hypothetical protein
MPVRARQSALCTVGVKEKDEHEFGILHRKWDSV